MTAIEKDIKCVVWDLDNTLWHGVLHEPGTVILKQGMKEIIQTLDSRGILQSIASRNNYDDACRKLKELDLDHYFLYPEINWNTKSASIANIQANLQIAMDSIMFVDDDPFERAEVQNIFRGVTCIDASEYTELISQPALNPRFITKNSKKRRLRYIQGIMRNKKETTFVGPPDEFLASLNMKLIISEAKEEDLQRAQELTIRSSHLNATGFIYNYDELLGFIHSDKHKLLICELTDKYGSHGKIGLALIELCETYWHLRLLLVSCRVISRGIGTVLLTYIIQLSKTANKKLLADFKKTDRNRVMYISYKFAGFKEKSFGGDDTIIFEK